MRKIEVDDEIVAEVLRHSESPTTRGAIEEAVRTRIRIRRQSGIRRLRGKVTWEGDLDAMRTDDQPGR
jgi:Arc/MetJ family transcription regulator